MQFIYPSFLLHANAWPDGVLANAVCRAYNTWLNETCNQASNRLKGVGVVSLLDPEGAAKEITRLHDMGVRAVMINGTAGARRLDHPAHEVFFAEADRVKMPIAVHFSLQFPFVDTLFEHHFPNRVLAGIFPIMAGLTSVLCSGLLDRYKNLKFAFLEGGISWVPAHVERMDDHFDNPRYGARDLISHPPSDYLKDRPGIFRLRRQRAAPRQDRRRSRRRPFHVFVRLPARRPHGRNRKSFARSHMTSPLIVRKKLLDENARRFYGL